MKGVSPYGPPTTVTCQRITCGNLQHRHDALCDLDHRYNVNGDMSIEEATRWLVDYALMSPQRARQRVDFISTCRSYVINYNLGKDMVRQYIERDTVSAAQRWQEFQRMLSTPTLPADLQ
ncbi:MAG: hypothetical protein GXP15_08685 [Gammaproteobacteria bacterium]|nr:hypothetical protein [Gammaproteobacteria bacterium]